MKKVLLQTIVLSSIMALVVKPTFAATTVYDALPSVDPLTSYPSQPFQAQQTNEFGDEISLGGTDRIVDSVIVTMVTWARFSEYSENPTYSGNDVNWTHPITVNIYDTDVDVNGEPTTLLATITQDIIVPWRPEGDPTCPNAGYGEGFAWKNSEGICLHGLAFNATFDLSSLDVELPNDVIVSVAYNTQTWGYSPLGESGPYNSLNVAVPASQPVTVGNDINTDSVFWNTETASYYSDGGPAGYFREDTNWTPYGTVALKVVAKEPFVRSAEITSPIEGSTVSGIVSFDATLTDKDMNDSVQWAVRKGTCVAGVGTVLGNVDGHSDTYTWDHITFQAIADTSTWEPGSYCFIFNPTESAGDATIRLTSQFVVEEPVVGHPTNKEECKKDGWKTFKNPTFKNQGDCVSYIQSNENAKGNKKN